MRPTELRYCRLL